MKMFLVAIIVCVAVKVTEGAADGHWDYGKNGPSTWGKDYPNCNLKKQSPINIVKMNVKIDKNLSALQQILYTDVASGNLTIKNTGKTVLVTPSLDNSTYLPKIIYNDTTYQVEQFHFHWGVDDNEGSEHTIGSKKYPAEVHFVHWNTKYSNFSEALPKADGLLVWGFLIDVGETNDAFDPIVAALPNITYEGSQHIATYIPLASFLPEQKSSYFTYSGSLTTPTCDQSVTWIVSQTPIKMSKEQIAAFRTLYTGKNDTSPKLTKNYRPVQDLNGREVKSNVVINTGFNFLEDPGYDYSTNAIGPANWGKNFYYCDASRSDSRQSPININTGATNTNLIFNASLPSLKLTNYDKESSANKYKLKNNGHSITVEVPSVVDAKVTYKGQTYKLAQFHFHSGSTKTQGSEHLIDDVARQAEVHFVHWNTKYQSIGIAMKESDGLLVSGYFMQAKDGAEDHEGYQKLFETFDDLRYYKNTTEISYFPVEELIVINSTKFFTYLGSLTTPYCFESVTWIVNQQIIDLSPAQMAKFGNIYNKEMGKLENNYRPTQRLNDRKVYTNIPQSKPSGAIRNKIPSLFIILVGFMLYLSL